MKKISVALCFTLVVLLVPQFLLAQYIKVLPYVSPKDTTGGPYAIIYGSCIQRLALRSDGHGQFVSLVNVSTHERYELPVKPRDKAAKQNLFCYYLPAGQYVLTTYRWGKMAWPDWISYNEAIFADIDSAPQRGELADDKNDPLFPEGKKRFSFTVEAGTINYLGIWHFETGLIHFENDKEATDKKLQPYLRKIKLTKALSAVPQ